MLAHVFVVTAGVYQSHRAFQMGDISSLLLQHHWTSGDGTDDSAQQGKRRSVLGYNMTKQAQQLIWRRLALDLLTAGYPLAAHSYSHPIIDYCGDRSLLLFGW